ncbi:MAG TPA: hypothetical protein VF581_10410 [Flavobacterium sp.]
MNIKDKEMVDYTKIYLKNIDIARLLSSSILDFKCEYSTSTSEVNETKLVAKINFCEITVYQNKSHALFTGSIHKFWNELKGIKAPKYDGSELYKGFNGNQFTIDAITDVRLYLQQLFNCEPEQMIFQNIEFGVNSTPGFEPKLFLKGLLYHKSSPFEYSRQGNYAQSVHQRYVFKIYNKSYQYDMDDNVLRVELKFKKMEDLSAFNIRCFADISESKLDEVMNFLLQKFDEVMYYDYSIRKNELRPSQTKALTNYSNPRYWIEELKPNHRDRHKKILREVIENHSARLHKQIGESIIEKCVTINRHSNIGKCVIINTSSIELIPTQNTIKTRGKIQAMISDEKATRCIITGLDISMQREDSILLSHCGLKYYLHHEPRTFEQLKLRFLSRIWADAPIQLQIKEIAHNIRNTRSNQNIQQGRLYNDFQINILAPLGIQ